MKQIKDKRIEVKLSAEEKELFKNWCAERGITQSEFIRALINKELARKEQK